MRVFNNRLAKFQKLTNWLWRANTSWLQHTVFTAAQDASKFVCLLASSLFIVGSPQWWNGMSEPFCVHTLTHVNLNPMTFLQPIQTTSLSSQRESLGGAFRTGHQLVKTSTYCQRSQMPAHWSSLSLVLIALSLAPILCCRGVYGLHVLSFTDDGLSHLFLIIVVFYYFKE